MVLDKHTIRLLKKHARIDVPKELETILLDRLGQEPLPYSYTEQDIYEQTWRIIKRYNTPVGRLELLYGVDKLETKLDSLRSHIWSQLSDREKQGPDIPF